MKERKIDAQKLINNLLAEIARQAQEIAMLKAQLTILAEEEDKDDTVESG